MAIIKAGYVLIKMNQGLTMFLSAILVGILAIAILAGYTSAMASKLPEQNELIQIFLSGAIVGTFMSWLVTSGMLHGSSVMGMLTADVTALTKEIGLKGGDETNAIVEPVSKAVASSGDPLSGMVGGFFKAMGLDSNVLQELNVGMPSF